MITAKQARELTNSAKRIKTSEIQEEIKILAKLGQDYMVYNNEKLSLEDSIKFVDILTESGYEVEENPFTGEWIIKW